VKKTRYRFDPASTFGISIDVTCAVSLLPRDRSRSLLRDTARCEGQMIGLVWLTIASAPKGLLVTGRLKASIVELMTLRRA
jgi:hypothetical protein